MLFLACIQRSLHVHKIRQTQAGYRRPGDHVPLHPDQGDTVRPLLVLHEPERGSRRPPGLHPAEVGYGRPRVGGEGKQMGGVALRSGDSEQYRGAVGGESNSFNNFITLALSHAINTYEIKTFYMNVLYFETYTSSIDVDRSRIRTNC